MSTYNGENTVLIGKDTARQKAGMDLPSDAGTPWGGGMSDHLDNGNDRVKGEQGAVSVYCREVWCLGEGYWEGIADGMSE